MFGRSTKNPKPTTNAVNPRKGMNPSVIAENMCVLGNIVSDGVLDIDGQVDGNIRAHTVTVRENAKIRGDVMAEEIFIYGSVEGLIKATNVTLFASAKVGGTIMHESITIEDGAEIDGKLKRTERLLLSDQSQPPITAATASADNARRVVPPTLDSNFDNDNDEPQSEAEIRVLENLRLIS